MTENDNSWKNKFLIGGAVMGAVIGVATAYLLTRTAEEEQGGPPNISATEALTLGISTIGLVRGIAQLGSR